MTVHLMSSGCFDVRPIDAGPPVLDDFEDGDLTPSFPHFMDWSCATFHPDAPVDCTLTPGFASAFGVSTAFSISDPPDAVQQHGGVFIQTVTDRPIDLTASSAITFAVRLTNAPAEFPAGALMHLDLQCSTAIGDNGVQLTDFAVVQSIAYSTEWSTVTLAIANFGSPPWRTEHIRGGAAACLRAVDGFSFVFDAAIPDGQTGEGVFSIDEVRLQ
jgi:hypothetical protein